jgi:hypothetical protein
MWLAPNAEQIEAAADSLKSADPKMLQSQAKELMSFGPGRAQQINASGLSEDFQVGYTLGLQTARKVLSGSVALALKGVDPSEVL